MHLHTCVHTPSAHTDLVHVLLVVTTEVAMVALMGAVQPMGKK